jgi:hypothetical protein
MNYDNLILGVGNSSHPANQEETELELTHEEQMENEILELESRINQMRNAITYRKAVNSKIIELLKSTYANDFEFLHNKLNELL